MMKKLTTIILIILLYLSLVACSGGSTKDPLIGTWIGEDDFLGGITFEFKAGGKGEYKNSVFETPIKYVVSGSKITITQGTDTDSIEYTYTISGSDLTLDATNDVAVDYELKKK